MPSIQDLLSFYIIFHPHALTQLLPQSFSSITTLLTAKLLLPIFGLRLFLGYYGTLDYYIFWNNSWQSLRYRKDPIINILCDWVSSCHFRNWTSECQSLILLSTSSPKLFSKDITACDRTESLFSMNGFFKKESSKRKSKFKSQTQVIWNLW